MYNLYHGKGGRGGVGAGVGAEQSFLTPIV